MHAIGMTPRKVLMYKYCNHITTRFSSSVGTPTLSSSIDSCTSASSDELKAKHLQLYHDIITKDEEELLLLHFDTIFNRKRYEGNHWDDVIQKYKEIELNHNQTSIPIDVNRIIAKISDIIKSNCSDSIPDMLLLSPHVIDLHSEGEIHPHIDSIKFSGGLVAGVSILSSRVLKLTSDIDVYKDIVIEEMLPRRSLYLLQGPLRYDFKHAILGSKSTSTSSYPDVAVDRRLSIIFRDEKVDTTV